MQTGLGDDLVHVIIAYDVTVFSVNEIVTALMVGREVDCQNVRAGGTPGSLITASARFERADAWDKLARIHQPSESDEVERHRHVSWRLVREGGIGRRNKRGRAYHVCSNLACEQ